MVFVYTSFEKYNIQNTISRLFSMNVCLFLIRDVMQALLKFHFILKY